MGDPRVKILIKVLLDFLFIAILITIFFQDIFQYMDNYYIRTATIMKEAPYTPSPGKSTTLTEIIIATYSDFENNFCKIPEDLAKYVCSKRADFETSGILYIVFCSVTLTLTAYGLLGLFAMACGCSCCGLFRYSFTHYLYPFVYAISLVLFTTISGLFSLSNPTHDSSNDMKPQISLILMFVAQLIAIASAIFFFFYKSEMTSLVLVTHEGYTPVKA